MVLNAAVETDDTVHPTDMPWHPLDFESTGDRVNHTLFSGKCREPQVFYENALSFYPPSSISGRGLSGRISERSQIKI